MRTDHGGHALKTNTPATAPDGAVGDTAGQGAAGRPGGAVGAAAGGPRRAGAGGGAGGAGGGREKAAEIAREAAVLAELERPGASRPATSPRPAPWPGGNWLAAIWIEGTGLWNALSPAREPGAGTRSGRAEAGVAGDVRALLQAVTGTLAEALAALHAAGWAYADVQPTNIRVTQGGSGRLIDYALACGPELGAGRTPYRGALTHTTSPELAARLLDTEPDTHVQAEPADDVWALAATVLWCWTGQPVTAYRDPDVARPELLADIAERRLRGIGAQRRVFPELADLLTACLRPPGERPSAEAVARGLRGGVA